MWMLGYTLVINELDDTPRRSIVMCTWCLIVFLVVFLVLLSELLSLCRQGFNGDFTMPEWFRCTLDHTFHLVSNNGNICIEFFICLWLAVKRRLNLFNLRLYYDKFVNKNNLCCLHTWENAEYTVRVLFAIHSTFISVYWLLGCWNIYTWWFKIAKLVKIGNLPKLRSPMILYIDPSYFGRFQDLAKTGV